MNDITSFGWVTRVRVCFRDFRSRHLQLAYSSHGCLLPRYYKTTNIIMLYDFVDYKTDWRTVLKRFDRLKLN